MFVDFGAENTKPVIVQFLYIYNAVNTIHENTCYSSMNDPMKNIEGMNLFSVKMMVTYNRIITYNMMIKCNMAVTYNMAIVFFQ